MLNDIRNFLPRFWKNTDFWNTGAYVEGFADWILNTPDLSLQFVNLIYGTLPGQRYDYYT